MISIIIPAFNAERTIIETLLSIKKQTYQDYEVLIVNDGSTDNTQSLIQDFISQQLSPERWRLFNQSNSGVSQARNIGIRHSTGEYIFFVTLMIFCLLDLCMIYIITLMQVNMIWW